MPGDEKPKLRALADIALIDITLEFDKILKNILKITCETMNAHSGTMMLVDEDSGELRMVSSYGLPDNYIEMVYEAAEKAGVHITYSPSGTVLETGKYYIVPNLFDQPNNKPWFGIARKLGFSSQIFTPMKQGTKVIGLLNVYWEKVREFQDEEIDFVSIAASQASSVVQNARMCRNLKANIQELTEYREHLEEKVKETSQKLFDSELYLRTILNSSFDGIFVIDDEGRFEYGNAAFFNILGWQKNEIIGEYFMKVIPDEMHEFMLEKWNEIQNGIEIPYETKFYTNRGGLRHLYISHSRTKIKENTKYVFVIKDISDYKKLTNNLKESEEKYRELFENAHDPMYTHDTQGIIISMNEIGCRMLGASSGEEVVGTHFSRWLTPESYEYAQNTLIQHITGAPVEQPIVLEVVCKNGEHKWAEIRNRPILEGGIIKGIHGVARDITEKKKLEQQLLESYEKLKDADKQKTEFISNITHELMTPLTAIKGFTELIKDETLGSINDEQRKSLETIFRNSKRLNNLINQLLQATNLERDLMELNNESVSIACIISKAVDDIQLQADAKQIRIFQNLKKAPEIHGDRERLYDVIINLLSNSVKFTPVGGAITVNLSQEENNIHISVSDTGIGIPPYKLSRIFDRFYQVDGSESRKYGGTGLGLSLCRNIIGKHRGSIWAESDGKKGSIFHILLPKALSNNQVTNQGDYSR